MCRKLSPPCCAVNLVTHNTAVNACCIAANDLGATLAGYDITTLRAFLNGHAATCTTDTPYKLKDQP